MSAKLSSKNFYGGNLMVKCFVALVIFFCSVGNLFAQTETKVTIDQNSVGTVTKRNKGPFRL